MRAGEAGEPPDRRGLGSEIAENRPRVVAVPDPAADEDQTRGFAKKTRPKNDLREVPMWPPSRRVFFLRFPPVAVGTKTAVSQNVRVIFPRGLLASRWPKSDAVTASG